MLTLATQARAAAYAASACEARVRTRRQRAARLQRAVARR